MTSTFLIFIMVCAFIHGYIKEANKPSIKRSKNYDFFTLGYVQSDPINIVTTPNICITTPAPAQHTPSAPPAHDPNAHKLYLDCIDTLVSLGFKKSLAKKRVNIIFSTCHPVPKTIQEFLNIAFKQ